VLATVVACGASHRIDGLASADWLDAGQSEGSSSQRTTVNQLLIERGAMKNKKTVEAAVILPNFQQGSANFLKNLN